MKLKTYTPEITAQEIIDLSTLDIWRIIQNKEIEVKNEKNKYKKN